MKLKIYKHWSPRYFFDKFNQIAYDKSHFDQPWWTKDTILILNHYLKPTDIGLEYGSGRSTYWTAGRVKHITSVEHNKVWLDLVKSKAKEKHTRNLDLIFKKEQDEYIKAADRFDNNSLDFIIDDGLWRDKCAVYSLKKLKPGGIFILDDSQRYVSIETRSPESLYPNKPSSKEWQEFSDKIKNWRCLWTSNGVQDTAIFIKPHIQ